MQLNVRNMSRYPIEAVLLTSLIFLKKLMIPIEIDLVFFVYNYYYQLNKLWIRRFLIAIEKNERFSEYIYQCWSSTFTLFSFLLYFINSSCCCFFKRFQFNLKIELYDLYNSSSSLFALYCISSNVNDISYSVERCTDWKCIHMRFVSLSIVNAI